MSNGVESRGFESNGVVSKTHRVPVGETTIVAEEWGTGGTGAEKTGAEKTGATRPVVLVHAYPMRRQLYRDVVGRLSASCRVIACDNRGFGESDVTPGVVTMERYADDLAAVLDHLQVGDPAVVAGVSMGGYIAMRFAERHRERVAGLFLCNTRTAADTADAAAKRESLAQKIEAEGAQVSRGVPEKLLGVTSQKERPELCDELRSWILETDPSGIAAALRGMAGRDDLTELIRSYDKPVYFLGGDEDTFTPAEEMRSLAASIGKPITILERSGHLSPIERPEQYANVLMEFLTQLG